MPETLWVDRRPGQFEALVSAAVVDDSEGMGDGIVLMGDLRVPDRVRVPTELGGGEARVLRSWFERCPHPGCAAAQHDVRWYELERGFYVAECVRAGFAWMRQ